MAGKGARRDKNFRETSSWSPAPLHQRANDSTARDSRDAVAIGSSRTGDPFPVNCISAMRLARRFAIFEQSRRMIGAVIPPGWVAGNSLHVAHFHGTDLARLHALHGILSSFVFEAQVRLRLTTGHMSLGIVRRAHLPDLTSSVINAVYSAVSKALKSDGAATLEVAVARAYGLGREDMADLLARFPKIASTEREAILAERLWR